MSDEFPPDRLLPGVDSARPAPLGDKKQEAVDHVTTRAIKSGARGTAAPLMERIVDKS